MQNGVVLGNEKVGAALPPEPVTKDSVNLAIYFPSMEIANVPTGEQNSQQFYTKARK